MSAHASDGSRPAGPPDEVGWRVGQSMALELDAALWLITQRKTLAWSASAIQSLAALLQDEWLAEMSELFGNEQTGPDAVLEELAWLAGVMQEADYSRATLAMRELTPTTAAAALQQLQATATGAPDPALAPAERFTNALVAQMLDLYARLGLESSDPTALQRQVKRCVARLTRVLAGGDLHARFWHWLDRFYYEAYRPWRLTRAPFVEAAEQRARAALGDMAGAGAPPLGWLPPQNTLTTRAGVRQAVSAGRTSLFFWAEPFGLLDLVAMSPGWVYASFGEADPQIDHFRRTAADVAARTKALGDPTRLTILRLIRNFGMDNTEMANFLGIARPTVSVHAKLLREAGLIETRQVGRQARHTINSAAVRRLLGDLDDFLDLPPEAGEG